MLFNWNYFYTKIHTINGISNTTNCTRIKLLNYKILCDFSLADLRGVSTETEKLNFET